MSDNALPSEEIELKIVLKDGRVTVKGPVQNQLLCYEMMFMARNAIVKWHEEQLAKMTDAPTLNTPSCLPIEDIFRQPQHSI